MIYGYARGSTDGQTVSVQVAALTEAGADVSVRADNQQRPLDLALTKGQQAMVDFLEAHGASL